MTTKTCIENSFVDENALCYPLFTLEIPVKKLYFRSEYDCIFWINRTLQPNWSPPTKWQDISVRPTIITTSKNRKYSQGKNIYYSKSQLEMPKYAESSQSKEFAVSWLLGLTALVADINILDSAQFDFKMLWV